MNTNDLTIRRTHTGDEMRLHRLASLDSAHFDGAPALVAEVDGRLVAALPLDGGAGFADPFTYTGEALAMLRLRRNQLSVSRALPAGRRRRRYRAPASA